MSKSPLAIVKEKFGSKEALVARVAGLVTPLEGETKDDLKTRLSSASNSKLLKLLNTEEKVAELFGSKDKLVDEYLKLQRPTAKKVDSDYRKTLVGKSKGELLALQTAASKKAAAKKRKAS